MFQFKQFTVDQTGCAMKINTDGVLLGAMVNGVDPRNILDIGTGTGIIAMMLAQRFPKAKIDAVEIDKNAASTATRNFKNSSFSDRLQSYHAGFETFLENNIDKKYDLIVSNPPFYTNSLKSPSKEKNTAKHADDGFFDKLVPRVEKHLSSRGTFWLILPDEILETVKNLATCSEMFVSKVIAISSFPHTKTHRAIIAFSRTESHICSKRFVIYQEPKIYSAQYTDLMKDYFTIF